MSPSQDGDVAICPATAEKLRPAEVWKSKLNGQDIWYALLKKHHHHGEVCEWSGLVVRLEPRETAQPPLFVI